MKNIKLIASDIDGTLLLNGAKTLNPKIFIEIRKLREQGILFMAASGREYTNLRSLFSPVADDIIYLCLNGCLTFYHDQCISKEIMDTDIAKRLITTIQYDNNAEALISGEKTCYITPKNQSYYEHLANTVKNHVTIVDDLFNKVKAELIAMIHEDVNAGEQASDLLMAAKYFERIGDHATNISEWVIFSITGQHPDDK